MTPFLEKTIKFLGKSQNPSSVDILTTLLSAPDVEVRGLAFDALFLKKTPEVLILLFECFVKDEEEWSHAKSFSTERLFRLADCAYRSDKASLRDKAAEIILKYKLYETLPAILLNLEGSDEALSRQARDMVLNLAESFYGDLLAAPSDLERRNMDRRREWFVQQLDGPLKRYAVHGFDETVQALLIITRKEYDAMKTLVSDHRSAACKRIVELLSQGEHGSYIRLLLSYVSDVDSPAVIDQVLSTRSDALFVRKLLELVGPNPKPEFRDTLKRFKSMDWLQPGNPNLPALTEGLERNAVQLVQSGSFPKDLMVRLQRFFLERPSVDSRRAAAEALRRLVGDDVDHLLLQHVNDPDPTTASIIFRTLKSRHVKELEQSFAQLVERPEEEIRKAIYDTMPELHVESFASRIGQLTPGTVRTMGRYVRRVDPNTYKVIADDIMSPIPIRRLSACGVAMATGYAPEFIQRLIDLADADDEVNVRIAAISALGTIITKEAVEVLKAMLNDRSMDVRDAANAAIREWMATYQAKIATTQ